MVRALIYLCVVAILTPGCKFTVMKPIVFQPAKRNVLQNIRDTYEISDINASTFKENEDSLPGVLLELKNVGRLPDEADLSEFGSEIANQLVDALENPKEYKSIKVAFINGTSIGMLSKIHTTYYTYDLK